MCEEIFRKNPLENTPAGRTVVKTMAAKRQRNSNWTLIDLPLVKLVYDNREILNGGSKVTMLMKKNTWKNIASLLELRGITDKPGDTLRERWNKLKKKYLEGNPTGTNPSCLSEIDSIIKSISEYASQLSENDAIEGGPPNMDQHSKDESEDFSVDESGSQENDLDMVIRKLTYDKLKLEIQLLELKIKRRREDSHPSTS